MNKFKYGIIFGKFAPLTQGHINFINKSSLKCDKLYVFLSFDQKFVDKQKNRDKKILTLRNRLLWLKNTYKDLDHIEILSVDETDLPSYPNGWQSYTDLIRSKMPIEFGDGGAVFTSEPEYDENLKKYFPELTHEIIDFQRSEVSISATEIRNDIYKHWGMIPSVVRKEYTLKVCIIGTESSGKTTLVKYLAKQFNTSWVEEYGRKYCEENLFNDTSLLNYDDYINIAYQHKVLESEAYKNSNKVTFVDSNAFITEFYHRLQHGCKNEVVSAMAHREKYDLIIYMSDEVEWKDDSIRIYKNNRNDTKKFFENMLEEFPNQKESLVFISGKSYEDRFEAAKNEVYNLLESYRNGG